MTELLESAHHELLNYEGLLALTTITSGPDAYKQK